MAITKTFQVGGEDGFSIELARPTLKQMRPIASKVLRLMLTMDTAEQISSDIPLEVMKIGCDKDCQATLDAIFDSDYTYPVQLWQEFVEFAGFETFLLKPELKRLEREQEENARNMQVLMNAGMKDELQEILARTMTSRLSTTTTQDALDGRPLS